MQIRFQKAQMFILCAALLAHSALGQFSQQGSKRVAADSVGSSDQGSAVSLSADGNTAIVGGDADNTFVGAAWIWTRSGGVWTEGPKLLASDSSGFSRQGSAVSVSADGSTALVGGSGDGYGTGAAWIWTRNGGSWRQQGGKLTGTGAVGIAYQGISVSLSADGNTAIVGGFADNSFAGAAWVWTREGGLWKQQGPKLLASDAYGTARQGFSVALSADGNTAIIGGPTDAGGAGAAWIWTRSGGVWTQLGPKLFASSAVGQAAQGVSVCLSTDGRTAVVGGNRDNTDLGAAWVWASSGGTWTQTAKLVGEDAIGAALQGVSTSLSADGTTAIVGGSSDNAGAGGAWVWRRSGGVWSQHGTKLVGSGAVGSALQGWAVSLSGDGQTAIIGGRMDNDMVGAAWFFVSTPEMPRRRAVRH